MAKFCGAVVTKSTATLPALDLALSKTVKDLVGGRFAGRDGPSVGFGRWVARPVVCPRRVEQPREVVFGEIAHPPDLRPEPEAIHRCPKRLH